MKRLELFSKGCKKTKEKRTPTPQNKRKNLHYFQRTVGVLIGVNHDLQHIFIGFRSTNDPVQFVSQFYVFMMGWFEDFPLGGRMVAIYSRMYRDILQFGFDECLGKAVEKHPTYSLLVTGHSLGGAMATIFSLHVAMKYPQKQTRLYSLSAPRSGDETFVKLLNQYVRN